MTGFGQDIRYAVRHLGRSPLFSAVAVLSIAVGIAANTAVFAALYAALLRPLPFPKDSRVVIAAPVAPGVFLDWQRQARSFQAMAAYRVGSFDLKRSDLPQRVNGAVVSARFFDVLGATPFLGRGFLPGDETSGTRPVVLSHAFWTQQYGADRRVIGQTAVLDGAPFIVVGVMPPGVDFPFEINIWMLAPYAVPSHPLHPLEDPTNVRSSLYLGMCARLLDGVSIEQARIEQRQLLERVRSQYPNEIMTEDVVIALRPVRQWLFGDLRSSLLLLALAVGLVFLTACANVASLLLARAASRRKEIDIRAAIGASAGRIVRQILTESAVLGAIAGGLGTCVAAWLLPHLLAVASDDLRSLHPTFGVPVFLFGVGLSIAAGLLSGIAPAATAARPSLIAALMSSRTSAPSMGRRLGGRFLALQFAVCVALLATAGLLTTSLAKLRNVDPGFEPADLFTVEVALPATRYATPDRQRRFFDALLERVGGLPGVESVAAAGRLPFAGIDSTRTVLIEGTAAPPGWGGIRVVSPDYFAVMDIHLRRGRWLSQYDRSDSPRVAVINATMARRYWPDGDPVGHRFRVGDGGPPVEVVGEVSDSRFSSLREGPEPEFYVSYRQDPWAFMSLVVRTRLETGPIGAAVSRIVHGLDADLAVGATRPLSDLLVASMATERLETIGIAVFATLTLLLASMGLYGVTAYLAGQRTREVGIRMALGAAPGRVVRQFIVEAIRPLLPGLIAGAGLALVVARLLHSQLFAVSAGASVALLGLGTAVSAAVAVAASAIPAWRASRVDPAAALRTQ
jgi:putative ABC transport system permease protein